jgi:hypothetical protein
MASARPRTSSAAQRTGGARRNRLLSNVADRIAWFGFPAGTDHNETKETTMKTFLVSVCYPAGGAPPPPAALRTIMQDVGAVQREMEDAGAHVFSGGMQPSATARVVRKQRTRFVTTDGPFIESKEMIGGITILRAPDFDAALAWGRKLAQATTTPIEVRLFAEGAA